MIASDFATSRRLRRNMISGVAFGALVIAGAVPAFAQVTPPAGAEASGGSGLNGGDIIVTARRKSENILKTPISITALTSEDLARKGTATIQDIAQSTPGLNVQNSATAGARADRSFSSIQLRGFVPSTSVAQTTSIFIDGAPVSTSTALQAITSPERVEVIKGPQSALFGRQTFAGALNVVTKQPSDHLTGGLTVAGGTRSTYDFQGELSAPLVKDILSFRAIVRSFGKDGSWKNYGVPGTTLGDQHTNTASLALRFTPTENLTVKLFGLYTQLNDGPAATGLLSAYNPNPAGGPQPVVSQANCTVGAGNPFFCGVLPGLSVYGPSVDTAKTPSIAALLNGTGTRVVSPSQGVHGYGLVNRYYHVHANIDYALGDTGLTLSSLTAWNREAKSELADLDNVYTGTVTTIAPGKDGFYNFDFLIEGRARDFSQELRLAFENGGKIHGSFGGSYLNAWAVTDQGSAYISNPGTASGATQNRTYGIFGSISYDFSSQFSLSADGRYQIDKLYAFASPTGQNFLGQFIQPYQLVTSKVYKNFLPRVIGQFNLTPHNMFYASYSKGVNPGAFNTQSPASNEQQVRDAFFANGYQVAVDPEKLTNYEVGAKGRIGPVRYDGAAFFAIWDNQIQNQSSIFSKVGTAGGPAAAGSALQVTASVNTGRVRVWGLEGHTSVDLTKGLTLDLAGAYIKTYILQAVNQTVSTFYYGFSTYNFRGKENQFVSKWSGTASLDYTRPISDVTDGYGRVDFSYKSGGWTDISNTSRTPDLYQVDMRIGVRTKKYGLEAYVLNATNNLAYYNAGPGSLLLPGVTVRGQYGAMIAQLRDKRTFGARLSVKF